MSKIIAGCDQDNILDKMVCVLDKYERKKATSEDLYFMLKEIENYYSR